MVTLPSAFQISADVLSRNERADDITRLKVMMDLPDLRYVDISAQMELFQSLERWPLLAYVEQQRHCAGKEKPLNLQKTAGPH